jgi:hypothetical protein
MFENRESAQRVLRTMDAVVETLENSLYALKEKCSETEYAEYKLAVGGIMAEMYIRAISKIYSDFPDLEPGL